MDLASAARRHLKAAQVLDEAGAAGSQRGNRAVAGYLFGLAGELALKELMRSLLQMRVLTADQLQQGRKDPYYAHFPALRSILLNMNTGQGRRALELRPILENPRLFQYWDTKMRYAHTDDIKPESVMAWRVAAEALVDRMNAL